MEQQRRMLLLLVAQLLGLGSMVIPSSMSMVGANHPPRFELLDGSSGSEIVLKLKEGGGAQGTAVGSVIYRMRASDQDGDPLQFALLGQAANELLSVRPVEAGLSSSTSSSSNQADLVLIKELDREVSLKLYNNNNNFTRSSRLFSN